MTPADWLAIAASFDAIDEAIGVVGGLSLMVLGACLMFDAVRPKWRSR